MSETIFVEQLKEKDGKWAWTPEAIVIETEGDFTIEVESLDAEMCRMGKLLLKYGDLSASLNAELKRKEENLKVIAANIAGATRSELETKGERATEAKLNETVLQDQSYRTTLNALHVVRASTLRADHWWRSMNAKVKLLESLAFRQNAELRRGYN